ncbi:MAG: DNA adenine methylase [Thermoanaerobaculia bacterium]|nr:MAG: DNA adenine methylase [Thermoanaerobaculia bacterium]MBZ0102151.1 DNA adenine methylase [Thermoanaerobaculia bacterium]
MARFQTPLRYPGGKQRLAPFITEILEHNDAVGWGYAEPYAGGAGIAIELLLGGTVDHIYLNDSSRHIYAFWKAILTDTEAFCRRVSRASLTLDSWQKHREVVRHPGDHDILDLGFSTFFLNRCNRSGILTAGVIGGLNQVGRWRIDARFPRNELIKRIETIATKKRRITVTNLDAEAFMRDRVNKLPPSTLTYCDPPYYARAKRLYLNVYTPDDHVRLAKFIQSKLRRAWLVSYDSHAAISELYRKRRQFQYSIQYSAIQAYEGTECFIFSDSLKIPRDSALPYIAQALRQPA